MTLGQLAAGVKKNFWRVPECGQILQTAKKANKMRII
jgi:hypothetical protein